ncbi:hypothetical protein CTI12_AA135620 [Artemisia annua]|uniref:Uncharacterized protein n=1 Tax=Artemisia annua TaxID=35608 RepID=A0A2U1PMW3_ARTAN|nr:hypothetical protein CTI12_AA135620 [Artemisia annua]
MGSNFTYDQVWYKLNSSNCFQKDIRNFLLDLVRTSDYEHKYSRPMPYIGIYIAVASLLGLVAMAVDLFHGLRSRKLWFPCKYFTLNAASLSVIAVAIKLPMDINNSMPGDVDQATNLGSMAFMCTMMANLLPSLATMDNKELLANIIALVVLVITLVVNVCIQIITGVVSDSSKPRFTVSVEQFKYQYRYVYIDSNRPLAIIYVVLLLVLLIIHACSALTILDSKRIIESKYQAGHEIALRDLKLQEPERLDVEKLRKHVSNYWIMAGTGSPQFMTACSATTSASGVICAFSTILDILIMIFTIKSLDDNEFASDYDWSMPVIFITQFIGVLIGTIAPLCRCFASLSFKVSIKWIWDHTKVFKVERYWTRKLSDWKQSSVPFLFRSRTCMVVLENSKVSILGFCIGFQKTVVVACKMISLIPIVFMVCVLFCFNCWKWLKVMFSASGIVLAETPEQVPQQKDFSQYVLKLQVDMEPAERTMKGILKSMNRLIRKAEKQQPKNLMKLLQKSKGFEGVENLYCHHVPPLLSTEYPECWSLPLISLTTIAISLPNIQNDIVDSLLRSVSEGLLYVTLVEESLNATHECVRIQKAAKMLWLEVEVHHKWLGNKVKDRVPQVNTARNTLEWFRDTAKNVTEVETMDIEELDNNSVCKSVSANSMYHITQTILLSYQDTIDELSQEVLFTRLSSMISGILAACLTNLPQVIAMKCHTSSIEKREASVYAAAHLLGETMQIINNLQDRELPSLNSDEFPFINKWCAYFRDPFP